MTRVPALALNNLFARCSMGARQTYFGSCHCQLPLRLICHALTVDHVVAQNTKNSGDPGMILIPPGPELDEQPRQASDVVERECMPVRLTKPRLLPYRHVDVFVGAFVAKSCRMLFHQPPHRSIASQSRSQCSQKRFPHSSRALLEAFYFTVALANVCPEASASSAYALTQLPLSPRYSF